jgi:hypothetical protein
LTIWKFEFYVADRATVLMPKDACILSIDRQSPRQICIWAICNPDVELEPRHFRIFYTGSPFNPEYTKKDYIGMVKDGQFTLHVFESK